MKRRALLFACIEMNIGDDLFVDTICKRYPNTLFYITAKANYGSLKDIDNLRFSRVLDIWQRASTGKRRGAKRWVFAFLELLSRLYLRRFAVAVYIVGNSFKNVSYQGSDQSQWFSKRVRLTPKFYLLSTNFGPYSDPKWQRDFEAHFRECTDVCFRDKPSFDLFKDLDVVRWAPDAVFTRTLRTVEELQEPYVVISMIDCSLPGRPREVKQHADMYEKKLAETAEWFFERGFEVKLLTSNNAQDLPAALRMKARCRIPSSRISIIEYLGDLAQVEKLISQAALIVATRLHVMILSLLYKKPCLAISYDEKVSNLIASYGFDLDCIPLSTIGEANIGLYLNRLLSEAPMDVSDTCAAAEAQFKQLDLLLKDDK